MTPPKHVLVGPYRYRLVVDRAAMNVLSVKDGDVKLGECDSEHLTITVTDDLHGTQLRSVVLHEVLHSAFHVIGASDAISDEQEESLVRRLEPVLLGLLRANKGLIEWLSE